MKTPSSNVQKNHFEYLIIGDKNASVGKRRRYLIDTMEEVHFSLYSQLEPNCFDEAKVDEHWIKAIE